MTKAGLKITAIATSRIPSDTANSIQVMKACQGLTRQGHALTLLVPDFGPSAERGWAALAERYGLETAFHVRWLAARPALKRNDFAGRAVVQAARERSDLVYTWTGQSAALALAAGLATVYEVHDLPTGRLGPLWFRLFLRLKGRKRLAAITRALLDRLQSRYGALPVGQSVVAPNGVDLEPYAALPGASEARARLGLPDAVTVLCAGHLYAGRGFDLFLGLAERLPETSFVWVGGRPEDTARARQQAAAGGLRNVTLTGFVSQRALPGYQAAADVLLMPYGRVIAGSSGGNSAEICSPMKMFDYLAAGRAILSSDLPVIHEVLNEGNAVFAPPDDLDAWAAALAGLLRAPEARARLAAQARADAQVYSWQARARKVIEGL